MPCLHVRLAAGLNFCSFLNPNLFPVCSTLFWSNKPGNPYCKGRLSTFDLLALTTLYQLLWLQTVFTFLQTNIPRKGRSTILSVSLQLVFHVKATTFLFLTHAQPLSFSLSRSYIQSLPFYFSLKYRQALTLSHAYLVSPPYFFIHINKLFFHLFRQSATLFPLWVTFSLSLMQTVSHIYNLPLSLSLSLMHTYTHSSSHNLYFSHLNGQSQTFSFLLWMHFSVSFTFTQYNRFSLYLFLSRSHSFF